jgi:hypothetical protein
MMLDRAWVPALAVFALSTTPARAAQTTVQGPPPVASSSAPVRATTIPARQPDATPHELKDFIGVWDYNANDSVNAATGRPEQSPRSATQRTPGARGGMDGAGRSGRRPDPLPVPGYSGPDGGYGGGYGTGGYGGGGDGGPMGGGQGADGGPGGVGPTIDMVQQSRDLARDLLEVPEALTISLGADAVTFVDDLDRSRTYSTDGRKGKYQLGASRFDANMEWDGTRLVKHIEGPYGFKMTETYFLSGDGRRLFVIVRVGEHKKKDDPLVGFNRVYDRVN